MRAFGILITVAALAGCAPSVPDSSRQGVGFESYGPGEQTAQDTGTAASIAPSINERAISDEALQQGGELPTGGKTAGAPSPRVRLNNPGISDEQDFGAVSSRESIESDKARLEAQRRAYQVIQPTALPQRPKTGEVSIVQYALSTTNRVGQSLYRRAGLGAQSRFQRNCAKFASPDLAQEAFLKAGGPEKDRKGLDPDGDGFACYWDPTPFRLAVGRN